MGTSHSAPKRKQCKEFLQAAKKGDAMFTSRSLEMYPEIVQATTFLRRKGALHLAAESGARRC